MTRTEARRRIRNAARIVGGIGPVSVRFDGREALVASGAYLVRGTVAQVVKSLRARDRSAW